MASSEQTPRDWRRNDPDETWGRVLYRRAAETEARRSIAMTRKVRLIRDEDVHEADAT